MKKLAMAKSRSMFVLLLVAFGVSLTVTASASTGGGNSDFAHQCQHGGWMTLTEADGTLFANGGACVSHGAKGGLLEQTISFTSTNPSPVTALDPGYTPAASSTSGLAVEITLDASSTGCALAGGVVSFPASGTCVIDANQAGNGTWAAAAQKQQTIVINKKPQTISFTSTAPSPVTATYTPTATSTSGLAVAFTLDASSTGCALAAGVVTFPGSGTCVINANQAGNGTWAAAPQKQQTFAIVLQFVANGPAVPGLNWANETGVSPSSGTGSATVTWDTATNMMTVVAAFSGLNPLTAAGAPSGTTAAHIHCCTAAPIAGTAGVATTTPTFEGFPLGVTSGTYTRTFDMLAASSYNPSFVTANGGTTATAAAALLAGMRAGKTYFNIHTNRFAGGEIRGFLGP